MRGDWKDQAMQYRDIDRAAQAAAEAEIDAKSSGKPKQVERKIGARGFYGEFPATIIAICQWSPTMVEARVPGGTICVPVCDIKDKPWGQS